MLNAKNFGFAGGILWALGMFLTTIISIYTGYATQWLQLMADIYPGYTISWWGSLIGLLYGFIDASIALFLLAWIYNKLTNKKMRASR